MTSSSTYSRYSANIDQYCASSIRVYLGRSPIKITKQSANDRVRLPTPRRSVYLSANIRFKTLPSTSRTACGLRSLLDTPAGARLNRAAGDSDGLPSDSAGPAPTLTGRRRRSPAQLTGPAHRPAHRAGLVGLSGPVSGLVSVSPPASQRLAAAIAAASPCGHSAAAVKIAMRHCRQAERVGPAFIPPRRTTARTATTVRTTSTARTTARTATEPPPLYIPPPLALPIPLPIPPPVAPPVLSPLALPIPIPLPIPPPVVLPELPPITTARTTVRTTACAAYHCLLHCPYQTVPPLPCLRLP